MSVFFVFVYILCGMCYVYYGSYEFICTWLVWVKVAVRLFKLCSRLKWMVHRVYWLLYLWG
jgi:hypothetical protein